MWSACKVTLVQQQMMLAQSSPVVPTDFVVARRAQARQAKDFALAYIPISLYTVCFAHRGLSRDRVVSGRPPTLAALLELPLRLCRWTVGWFRPVGRAGRRWSNRPRRVFINKKSDMGQVKKSKKDMRRKTQEEQGFKYICPMGCSRRINAYHVCAIILGVFEF